MERKFTFFFFFKAGVLDHYGQMNNLSYVEGGIEARNSQMGIIVIQVKSYMRK